MPRKIGRKTEITTYQTNATKSAHLRVYFAWQ